MRDADWMTIAEAQAELGVCLATMYKNLARPSDHPHSLVGRKAPNGYHWAGVTRQSVAAYPAARRAHQLECAHLGGTATYAIFAKHNGGMSRAERRAQTTPRKWTRVVLPRCPVCTALVESDGDLCEWCAKLGDGPYHQFR
jgi:hypothetical protein